MRSGGASQRTPRGLCTARCAIGRSSHRQSTVSLPRWPAAPRTTIRIIRPNEIAFPFSREREWRKGTQLRQSPFVRNELDSGDEWWSRGEHW